ncbi:ATP synthase subunit [Mycotypha africana]|uniref:ATP synthase subunit n=1 Tax=Mycotypha africana TaxID=64632 RepID=UPI0022FFC95F|nr:ATP synthase subunit [Mycotypha africana]KAI8975213.1 ATP synthase subunit [Mycotypha africana]
MSTAARPLNDDEVFSEMKKMADEEFNIEKAKIVRQESLNIDSVFERKIKQAEVQKRIAQSNHVNKARLKILQERQVVLDDLFEEANKLIHELSNDSDRYTTLMEGLILQGAFSLMEKKINIRCREQDVEIVQSVLDNVADKYEESLKFRPTLNISDDYLPASSAGGVILSGLEDRITVDNTLSARLDIAKDEMLPQIRVALFGHSASRAFFN